MSNTPPQKANTKQKKPRPKFNPYWIYGAALISMLVLLFTGQRMGMEEINSNYFEEELLLKKEVEKVIIINREEVEVFIKEDLLKEEKHQDVAEDALGNTNPGPHYYFKIGSVDYFQERLNELQSDFDRNERIVVKFESRSNFFEDALGWLLPIFIIVLIWVFIMRRMSGGGGPAGQMFNFGKSQAKEFDKDKKVKVSFKDVAGLEGAKEEVEEVVNMMKKPERYQKIGAKMPKGILLTGPPGTGKTLIAKAMAGEADVPFFSISGSDFLEMFVGVGSSRVRDLFKKARAKAPAIIFIDEIEAIGKARGKSQSGSQANDERENTLNQLLVEMDGFSSEEPVIVLAATNRPDLLDKALVRPGRFDRQISIDLPDINGRIAIFNIHLKKIKLGDDISVKVLAQQTPGFSGADIANVCNEAALIAARREKTTVAMEDFNAAVDRVIGGLEHKGKVILPDERKTIAYHEAGHAVAGWFLEHAHPLIKVSIVPRGNSALGYAQYLPKEKYLQRKKELLDSIIMTLGGRAAEEVFFGDVSTGAQNDLEKVTKMIYGMITIYGMNESLGQFSFRTDNEMTLHRPYSEDTAKMIDEEARRLLNQVYKDTLDLIESKKEEVEKLAKALLEKEVIYKDDVEALIGPRPFKEESVVDIKEEQDENQIQSETKNEEG